LHFKRNIPVFYKKETPNKKSAIETGRGLLKAFYESIDMTGFEIVAIKLPLTARLYTDEKQPTDLILTGIIDLLLKDAKGNLIAVDHKTAKQTYAQETLDEDLQLTSYAYLPASKKQIDGFTNRIDKLKKDGINTIEKVFPHATVKGFSFDHR
jgi:hypothetical protein